jgi:protein-S-isoprenylcysteine O-methyltransferase Ste14
MATQHTNALKADIKKWWIKNGIVLILVGLILFLASGQLNWWMAWAYLASITIIVVANAVAMDPSLMAERSQLQEGTKSWDVMLASFVAIWGPMLVWLTAGLDARFSWSGELPLALQIVALSLVVLGGVLGTWSMAANRFFASTVRIQSDRAHTVISEGPYRYVRHPGYLGGILSMLMTPIALGSWVALVPGVLVACGYVLRTGLEDKVLQQELDGYREYAQKVRYRIVPGLW